MCTTSGRLGESRWDTSSLSTTHLGGRSLRKPKSLELLDCGCLCSFSLQIKLIDREKEHRQLKPKIPRALGLYTHLLPTDQMIGLDVAQ